MEALSAKVETRISAMEIEILKKEIEILEKENTILIKLDTIDLVKRPAEATSSERQTK